MGEQQVSIAEQTLAAIEAALEDDKARAGEREEVARLTREGWLSAFVSAVSAAMVAHRSTGIVVTGPWPHRWGWSRPEGYVANALARGGFDVQRFCEVPSGEFVVLRVEIPGHRSEPYWTLPRMSMGIRPPE